MNIKFLILCLIFTVFIGFGSYSITHSFFTDSELSTNNTFTVSTEFEEPDPFADEVASVFGTFGHCCDAGNLSSDPAVAKPLVIGAPDSPPDTDFIQISNNSSIVLQFVDNKAVPASGPDIRVHIYDTLFPANAKFEVSQNGTTFFEVEDSTSDSANVDLEIEPSGFADVKYVRITDLEEPGEEFPTLGFDLDALEALHNAAP